MNALTIKDLAVSSDLSQKDMRSVRGGHSMGSPSYPMFPMPSYTKSIDASQDLRQAQQVLNETADGSAFVSGVDVTNNTSQFGQNNILVGGHIKAM
jgi:ketopantoate hydroxymethyltransferase